MLLEQNGGRLPGGVADEQVRCEVIRQRGAGGLRPPDVEPDVSGDRVRRFSPSRVRGACPHVGTAGRFSRGASSLVVVQRNQTYFFGYLPGAPEQAVR